MYYAIGVSVSSLHRESTDSPIQHKSTEVFAIIFYILNIRFYSDN